MRYAWKEQEERKNRWTWKERLRASMPMKGERREMGRKHWSDEKKGRRCDWRVEKSKGAGERSCLRTQWRVEMDLN